MQPVEDMSIISLVLQASIVVQMVMVLLLALSFMSWWHIFSKHFTISTAKKHTDEFEDRFWGDLGFIHLCYDIQGMHALRAGCAERGFPFTVDSASNLGESFDMGEAAGHFSYIEDPDGTLIEFVETHKVPIIKKFGWYLDLRKRNPEKFLPNFIIKALGMNRVKD